MANVRDTEEIKALLSKGRLLEAKKKATDLCAQDSSDAEHWMFLAAVYAAENNMEKVVECCKKTLAIQPQNSSAHYNIAIAYEQLSDVHNAIKHLQHVVHLVPDSTPTLYKIALLQHRAGQFEAAIQQYQSILSVNPDDYKVLVGMGNAELAAGDVDRAIAAYKKAVSVNSAHIEAYFNLGNAYSEIGDIKAIDCYQSVINIQPHNASAYNSIGAFYLNQNNPGNAARAFEQAIKIKPDYLVANTNLGNAFAELNRIDEAIAINKKALSISPDYAVAHYNLGNILSSRNRLTEAIDSYLKAIECDPEIYGARSNLGNVYAKTGEIDLSTAYYKKEIEINPGNVAAHSNYIFMLLCDPDIGVDTIYKRHLEWSKIHAVESSQQFSHTRLPGTNGKIRIGYISPDFKTHSVATFFEPLLKNHDRKKFEVFLYSNVARHDDATTRFKQLADKWNDIYRMNDNDAFQLICDDNIDILIDLAGHSADNRLQLVSRKPAPIQVTYLGYPGTTGLDTIDYRITDSICDPVGAADMYHAEELIRLPSGFHCYSQNEKIVIDKVKNDFVTFGSFNHLAKINEKVLETWAIILNRVENSHLLLKHMAFSEEACKNRYYEFFESRGIARDRIELITWIENQKSHLEAYNRIDIALDTFPYNGTTTTCEALWMGVPVIALSGNSHHSRVSESLLNQIGLSDYVGDSLDEYIDIAQSTASDRKRLEALSSEIRGVMESSLLCDAKALTKDIEEAYLEMIANYSQ